MLSNLLTYLTPCLFNLYAEYLMRNAGLEEAQAGIKIAGRNINNPTTVRSSNSVLRHIQFPFSPPLSLHVYRI